jgi:hypothetical protein
VFLYWPQVSIAYSVINPVHADLFGATYTYFDLISTARGSSTGGTSGAWPCFGGCRSAGLESVTTDDQILTSLGLARSLLTMGDPDQLRAMAYDGAYLRSIGLNCLAMAAAETDRSENAE